mgnify:CR=1 FL=1
MSWPLSVTPHRHEQGCAFALFGCGRSGKALGTVPKALPPVQALCSGRAGQERGIAACGGGVHAEMAFMQDMGGIGQRCHQRQDRARPLRQGLQIGAGGRVFFTAPPQSATKPRERLERMRRQKSLGTHRKPAQRNKANACCNREVIVR